MAATSSSFLALLMALALLGANLSYAARLLADATESAAPAVSPAGVPKQPLPTTLPPMPAVPAVTLPPMPAVPAVTLPPMPAVVVPKVTLTPITMPSIPAAIPKVALPPMPTIPGVNVPLPFLAPPPSA